MLDEADINILTANLEQLTDEDKVRLGFIAPMAPKSAAVEIKPIMTGVAKANIENARKEAEKPPKKRSIKK